MTETAPAIADLVQVPTADLAGMGATYNPRKISDHDLEALRKSLRFFGAVEPIVVNKRSDRIVGGHQRVKAAEAEGLEAHEHKREDHQDGSNRHQGQPFRLPAGRSWCRGIRREERSNG